MGDLGDDDDEEEGDDAADDDEDIVIDEIVDNSLVLFIMATMTENSTMH